MYKSIPIIARTACLFFFVIFVFGCDSQTESPQAPQVVTQKIAAAPQLKPSAPSATPAPAQTKTPDASPATQSIPVHSTPELKRGEATAEKPATIPPPLPSASKPASPQESPQKPEKSGPVAPTQATTDKDGEKAQQPIAPEVKKSEAATDGDNEVQSEGDLKKMVAEATEGYNPAGKIDPFLPLYEEKPIVPTETEDADKQKKKRRIPLTPLERVDLSQLKLVGIIQAPTGNKALVEEASGKGYIIKKGTFIGIHAGRVIEILKDRVVVEEEVENVLGQFTVEKKELKLQKPPGEL